MGGKLAGLLLFLVLWGCQIYGREFPVTPVKNIQPNVTTEREVFAIFGEPYRRGVDSGYETWTYSFHNYEFFQLRDSKELYVVFNKDGSVRSYSFTTK